MTANVAQVFLFDESWNVTLLGIHAALRPGGVLVFETRDPRVVPGRSGLTTGHTHRLRSREKAFSRSNYHYTGRGSRLKRSEKPLIVRAVNLYFWPVDATEMVTAGG